MCVCVCVFTHKDACIINIVYGLLIENKTNIKYFCI